jgi:iron complex outermembrane receptor protein
MLKMVTPELKKDLLVRQPSLKANIFILVVFFFSLFHQNKSLASELKSFDLPKQQANNALIRFAEQADTTIIFSYDLTKQYQTNNISGFYTTEYALTKLLRNSGLIAKFYPGGQIRVEKELSIPKSVKPTNNVAVSTKTVTKPLNQVNHIEQISVLGSRANRRTIDTLPVPVDVFTNDALNSTGQHEIGKIIQSLAPSFNVSTSAISDGSDVLQPATLRGLGPDQTLVLINGKRRHQASLIHINNSIGRGTAGVDMNAIPLESVDYIEVLRDGAAAQYGSDAIAGVINIVLKGKQKEGNLSLSTGQYSRGDGNTIQLGLSKSIIFNKDTFISSALSIKEHQSTNRSDLHGACQFKGCTKLPDGSFLLGDPREIDAPRDTFNIGDAFYNQIALTLNGEHKNTQGKAYGFFTFSNRENKSSAFFRHNADSLANIELQDNDATIPEGFLPKINSKITDTSLNLGQTFYLPNDASLDLSYTYGKNSIDYHVEDSINSSFANALLNQTEMLADEIRNAIPRSADAYGLELSLQTINLNYTRHFSTTSFAMGLEHKIDSYKVRPGEEYAYKDYDTLLGKGHFPLDINAGIQGFPGISPDLAVNEHRTTNSIYVELNSDISDALNVITAIRHDNSASYGHSTNYKLSAYLALSEDLSLRANFSTGFRAPSMQQLYFNNISTQFIVNKDENLVPEVVKTFRNDSEIAHSLGIKKLTPEESKNLSFGSVYQLSDTINLSLDYYQIAIDQRIVISDKIERSLLNLPNSGSTSHITKGQFFLNGIETETEGIDLIATWKSTLLQADELALTLAANLTKTDIKTLYPLSSTTGNMNQDSISINQLYSRNDMSIIEEWQPKSRVHLSSVYNKEDWNINLSLTYYGTYTITDGSSQKFSPELITDLKFNYQLTHALKLFAGSNNLFDVMPDKNKIGNSRAGKIVDTEGNTIVNSNGVFKYSRRSAPFGYNGAYFYAGLDYQF